ncbi:sensor histidine kinase [Herbaspirillum rhizosphaerae]|uniref:sensor histidine kinase n=1 Tax=Herbaspirillum rhizosphaerae TaxID=346179 RepID=UPI001F0B23AB|nr:sensor histidine kinase [Herbaspirillum rhizosphaerae]
MTDLQRENSINTLQALADLVERNREGLLTRWRNLVRALPSAQNLSIPTLNDHVPALLDEIAMAFRRNSDESIAEVLADGTPPEHGLQRLHNGYMIEEVVAEYNLLRGCVHDLATQHQINLQGKPFHVMNLVFDSAIGLAVQTFSINRALEVQRRREEYLSFIAHDLRTPLNAVALASKVLEASFTALPVDQRAARMIKILQRNVQSMSSLVAKVIEENDNLRTESGVKLERRNIDLWPLVESMVYDLNPVAGTGSTRLLNDVPEDLVIYADADLLRRMMQNLIANALTHTPQGEVVIGAAPITGGGVECWVSDNGMGISKDRLELIFEKFESETKDKGGLGLGLAIFKTFVEAHDGTLKVDSEIGRGSRFSFILPGRAQY